MVESTRTLRYSQYSRRALRSRGNHLRKVAGTLLQLREMAITNDKQLAQSLYDEWDGGNGTPKSKLERRTWNDGAAHGRRFDRFIEQHLGIVTTKRSKQSRRIQELEDQIRSLRAHPVGSEPTEVEQYLNQSRESCLSALRVWNDPIASFRTGTFSLLFVAAWNSLAIAMLIRAGVEWREVDDDGQPILRDGSFISVSTYELINRSLPDKKLLGIRKNLAIWIDIRNSVAHRLVPGLDIQMIPWAQAGLLNYERILTEEFGKEYSLASSLSVPLQLSGFRNPDSLRSLKAAQSQLPLDVQAILSNAASVSAELLDDPMYTLRVAFIPVVRSSGRSPDSAAYFIRPEEVSPELEEVISSYVIIPKAMPPRIPDHKPSAVVERVRLRIPYNFNTNDHARAARYLKIRPERDELDETRDPDYCVYIEQFGGYLYTDAWINRLVDQLSTADGYREATGRVAVRRSSSG